MATKKQANKPQTNRLAYIIVYLFTIISGIVVFVVASPDDKKLRRHAVQAIALGVISIALGFIPFVGGLLSFLTWIYGMYVGFNAYKGTEIVIPVVSDYVK
jgi:uncharacterized membrane protein